MELKNEQLKLRELLEKPMGKLDGNDWKFLFEVLKKKIEKKESN